MGAMSPPKRRVEHQAPRCSCRECRKMRFGTLDFLTISSYNPSTRITLFMPTYATPVLEVRRVVVSTIRSNQTFGCMCLLCVPLTPALFSGHFGVHPPQYFWIHGRGRAPKQMLQQCCRRRRCHLVCLFPNSFLRNIKRHRC